MLIKQILNCRNLVMSRLRSNMLLLHCACKNSCIEPHTRFHACWALSCLEPHVWSTQESYSGG